MRLTLLALAAGLALAPVPGFSHGQPPAPAHGGSVQDAHGTWVELAVNGDQVEVYLTDEQERPVAANEVSGTASVLIDGKIYKVQLTPGGENRLTAKLPVTGSGKMAATISLKIHGKAASARFANLG